MRNLIPSPRWLILAVCFLTTAIGLRGQTGGAPQTPAPAGPPAAPAGRGASLAPTAPQAPEEGLAEYPVPPEGFNVARENVPHGDVKLVEYDSKSLGTRRPVRIYTPPGYSADRKYP